MDIIDIMLARAMTPQGQTDIYVNKANQAAAKAEQAKTDASEAVATVEAAADEIATAREEAADLLAEARETLETAQQAQINTLDTEDVDEEIKKMDVSINTINAAQANTIQMVTTYPDNTLNTEFVTKLYKQSGQNEDGTMTQKAITNALSDKADITYINNKINISSADAGKYVMINDNGTLVAGSANITPSDEPSPTPSQPTFSTDVIGLDIDYETNSFIRTQQAVNLSAGVDFNQFSMYGGRTRCNVADDGTITAFYGDSGYKEDGTNGQVMVYQPKFYYKRIIYKTQELSKGSAIKHEALLLSSIPYNDFKLAPIFYDELDYVLFSAYNGSLDNEKLSSINGAIPTIKLTPTEAEVYATNRGTGWHIMNLESISANQMLQIVEFGQLNGQKALEDGITYKPYTTSYPCLAINGSTASLGNNTGHADSTTIDINGSTDSYSIANQRAISYRGFENPWGALWNMIGGVNIIGDGQQDGGSIFICDNFNYTFGETGSNYHDIGFNLPNDRNWVGSFGYGNESLDWAFIPAQCNSKANSLIPVGDNIWIKSNLNDTNILAYGGAIGFKEECGPFYYAADNNETTVMATKNYSARLMYIPTKNSIYTSNIAKWKAYIGG